MRNGQDAALPRSKFARSSSRFVCSALTFIGKAAGFHPE